VSEIHPPQMDVETAFATYMNYGPYHRLGGIPLAEMSDLCGAVRGAQRLSSRESVHAASMEIDLAWSMVYQGEDTNSMRRTAISGVTRASGILRRVAASSKSDQQAKLYAEFLGTGLTLHEAFLADSGEPLLKSYGKICAGYGRLAKKTLQRYENQEDMDEMNLVPWLRGLGGMLLMLEQPAGDLLPLPGPTRSSFHPSPGQENWFFQAWDVEAQRIYPVRISNMPKLHTLTFAPALLANDGYPSKSGHGTIEALLTAQRGANLNYARKDWTPPFTPAQKHIIETFQGFKQALRDHYEQETEPRTLKIPAYERQMNDLEILNASGELTTAQLLDLAGVNISLAALQASTSRITGKNAAIDGPIDRAQQIYEDILADPGDATAIDVFEARLGLMCLPMHRILIDPNMLNKTDAYADNEETFMENMMELGKDVMHAYKSCNPTRPEYKQLQELSHIITASLVMASQSWGSHMALPSLREERLHAQKEERSGISIIELPFNEEPHFENRGKVRVESTPKFKVGSNDILTLPLDDFDNNLSYEAYSELIDTMAFREDLSPEQQAYVGRMQRMLAASLDIIQ